MGFQVVDGVGASSHEENGFRQKLVRAVLRVSPRCLDPCDWRGRRAFRLSQRLPFGTLDEPVRHIDPREIATSMGLFGLPPPRDTGAARHFRASYSCGP
jgi:hypothetical protein